MNFQLTLVLLLAVSCFAIKSRYDNYKVYSLQLETDQQKEMVAQLQSNTDAYDFWSATDVMVPPHKLGEFEDFLTRFNIQFNIGVENLQELIDLEDPELIIAKNESARNVFDWTRFNTYAEIVAWLRNHVAASPYFRDLVIGTSTEGRPITMYHYSERANNRACFVECGMHAREWTALASCTWLINEIISSNDPQIRDMARTVDWYFLAIGNPDGVVFTETSQRLWRKTRQPWGACTGTDPNRYFDFLWNTGGASNNPCSEIFAGPNHFSEPETRALRDFYGTVAGRVGMYLSVHAFGHYVVMPYGHTAANSSNHAHLMSVGNAGGDAIRQFDGSDYLIATTAQIFGILTGSSQDWAFGRHNTRLSFTYEVSPRRGTPSGFVIPPGQIIPNNRAVMVGTVAMFARSRQLGYL